MSNASLPTSELARFYSPSAQPLGADWSAALNFVYDKRRPFSIAPGVDGRFVVSDAAGARIGIVRHEEALQHSSICDLIEHAMIPILRSVVNRDWDDTLRVTDGNWPAIAALFGPMRELTNLKLAIGVGRYDERRNLNFERPFCSGEFAAALGHVLPQLEQFELSGETLPDCDVVAMVPILRRMVALKRFSSSAYHFRALISANQAALPIACGANLFAGLESLAAVFKEGLELEREVGLTPAHLQFISTRCSALREFSTILAGDSSAYFAAFRALPNLAKVGLKVVSGHGLTFGYNEQPIAAVSKLAISFHTLIADAQLLKILTPFTGAKLLSVKPASGKTIEMLGTMSLVRQRGMLPQLESLKLHCSVIGLDVNGRLAHRYLSQFLGRVPNLPPAIDLTESICVAFSGNELSDLVLALRQNGVKSLALRVGDRFQPEAIDNLKAHLAERRELSGGLEKELDSFDPRSQSSQFCVHCVKDGVKDNEAEFKLRVVSQFWKRTPILED